MENYNDIYLLVGGNLNNTISKFTAVFQVIESQIGKIIQQSNFYESEPWGFQSQHSFINIALHVRTQLNPFDSIKKNQQIEQKFGRERNTSVTYQDRSVDIDIIFYNNLIINTEELIIPHPLVSERMFVLQPLAEIAHSYIHPVLHKSVTQLINECPDQSLVKIINL
ncbi:MAG: 2-amino-4-hydroxy-6-hydroxymethyldihydropteridine diphosphokinase [Bacteroidales bacterium]|jgi:2-amino-4-hydroxy-6-hydroxymethyldihydropteridine diphosphokinase|nr:2-amino-4-hydroxy-6-hydroxymethyldihydropteridine diphosphokinase [Bacteroidales bacterium]